MRYLISAMFIVAGLIKLAPVMGVVGRRRLEAMYGIAIDEPNLSILMRHRAVLFGLVGVLLLSAAFMPSLEPVALVAGFVSAISFLALAWSEGNYNALVRRVVRADVVVIVSLVVATAARWFATGR